jgi:regulator of protease activity HflC (stomatin/prohibitin superfamily)
LFDRSRKTKYLGLAVGTALLSTGCASVPPGYVGIKINRGGSQKGVQDYPLKTGWVGYIPFYEGVIEYPTFVQTVVWTKNPHEGSPNDESITFTTKDQLVINADVSLSYQLSEKEVPNFYVTFRADNIDIFTNGFLHNIARDAFNNEGGKCNVETIMGNNGPFLDAVRKDVQDQVTSYGVEIKQFGFIGAPRPPEAVIQAINAKAGAQQNAFKVEYEIKTAQAEAAKSIATAEGEAKAKIVAAEGESKANTAVVKSITPQLLQWFQLQNQKAAIDKWDGRQPQVVGDKSGVLMQLNPDLEPAAAATKKK